MSKTVITTDSGCNPRNMDNMVPCIVIDSNEINYYDMKKISTNEKDTIEVITNEEAFLRASQGEKLHTSSPTINDYITLITPYLENDIDVIHLSMGSGISAGSVNSSQMAANTLNEKYGNRVYVIDTLTAGSGGTVIVDYAEDLLKKGQSTKKIIEELQKIKSKILSSYYISKVEGFISSGRAPKEAILSDKLSLRYRIDVNDKGKLFPKGVMHGGVHKQFMKYLKKIVNPSNVEQYNPNYLALLITKLNKIELEEAKDYLKSLDYFNEKNINEFMFYSAIASYGVEDQVGIGLIKK
ncbi:MAG: DegV family protein [Bacilli bacterium]|nr:DegV family protein [Bacilli bacterium]